MLADFESMIGLVFPFVRLIMLQLEELVLRQYCAEPQPKFLKCVLSEAGIRELLLTAVASSSQTRQNWICLPYGCMRKGVSLPQYVGMTTGGARSMEKAILSFLLP